MHGLCWEPWDSPQFAPPRPKQPCGDAHAQRNPSRQLERRRVRLPSRNPTGEAPKSTSVRWWAHWWSGRSGWPSNAAAGSAWRRVTSMSETIERVPIRVTVNGKSYPREVEPRLLLVDFLREELDLTGTHIGCDTSYCGACTVLLNGASVKSCTVFAVQADQGE